MSEGGEQYMYIVGVFGRVNVLFDVSMWLVVTEQDVCNVGIHQGVDGWPPV